MDTYAITCCICDEVYNSEERKPLLLQCGHSFCRSCLLQIKNSINENLCPICRDSWGTQPVDSLPFIRQLVESENIQRMNKVKSFHNENHCAIHSADLIFWCNTCNISICCHCFIEHRKDCDFILIKEKMVELVKKLQESVFLTRRTLIKENTLKTDKNNSILTDIRTAIKKLQQYENICLTFAKRLSAKHEKAMIQLENFEYIPSISIDDLTTKLNRTPSLLDDQMTEANIPKFVVPDCDKLTGDTNSDNKLHVYPATDSSTDTATSSGTVRPEAHNIGTSMYHSNFCVLDLINDVLYPGLCIYIFFSWPFSPGHSD